MPLSCTSWPSPNLIRGSVPAIRRDSLPPPIAGTVAGVDDAGRWVMNFGHRYYSFIIVFIVDTARIERPPVAVFGAGRIVDEVAKLGRAAPAGLCGIDHLRIFTEREPRFQHLFRG